MNKRLILRLLCVMAAALLLAAGCAAAEEGETPLQLLIVWTDGEGAEQSEVVWQAAEDNGPVFTVEMPLSSLPELQLFSSLADVPEAEPEWTPVTAEHSAAPDGTELLTWPVGGTDSGRSAKLYIYLTAAPGQEPEPQSATELPAETPEPALQAPSGAVTVVVHYQTADGTPVAEDDTVMGERGTSVPVYAKALDDGWIIVSDPLTYVDIAADAPDTLETVFLYTRPTPTPAPPEVRLTVHYRDVGGVPVASDTVTTLPGGTEQPVYAVPEDLKPDYYPTSESVQQVALNTEGKPQEIIFFYTYQAPATPAPAYVIVRYTDAEGNAVAQEGRLSGSPGQEMVVYAAPEQLRDFYVLEGEETQKAILPESGESAIVTFIYRLELPQTAPPTATPEPEITPTPQPARTMGFVQVSYVYQGNSALDYSEPVTVYEGQTELSGAEGVRNGYRLLSAGSVTVTLDAEGRVQPNQVTFVYVPENSEVVMPELIVQYFAEDGTQVATSTLLTLHLGENAVYASPVDLKDGYEQITPSFTVNVDAQGKADADAVTFYYRQTRPNDDGKDSYQVLPYSGYARAKNDSVNLRSSPYTGNDSNVIGKISKTDVIELKGIATVGGKWFYVSVNERQGYVSASVVTELSEADVQVLLGLNAGENGDPADSGMIERWAQTAKKVWFRAEPNGKKLKELRKGTRVFVDEMTDEDGTLWCRVRYNGKEGYIMSEYLDIYSAAESQNLQLSLKSPVPTHTVQATRVPTSTPTVFIPTETPTAPPLTPTPVMTATPLPYTGYAVTNTRAVIRSGLSTDNPALVTLNGETLVMVQGQTYVNGVCWDSVRVVSSGVTGFVEDDRLFHVTNEVARDYLEILATPTPAATPENTPIPFTGYALILMDGVPMRQQMNSNAQIISVLNAGTVISVLRQNTAEDGASWCLIQSGMYLGYVRRDMLRQMTDMEIVTYLEANHSRPTATPAVTPTPRAQSAMASCWGIIKPDRANLRSEPSLTVGTSLRLMSRNEFVQVQGSFLGDDGEVWQQVMFNGLVGYLRADYVQILTQGELTSVVTSEEFKSANTTETTVTGADSIQSYETYLANQWNNPSVSASYEPFNPYTTPAAVASVATEIPVTPSITMPPTPQSTIIIDPDRTPQPNAGGGISFGAVFIGAAVLAVGGGAVFAWQAFRGKKRRQALQRAQAIRRRQQKADAQPEEARRPRTYRRDAPAGYEIEGSARPMPAGTRGAGDEGEYIPPVARPAAAQEAADGTRQFRRPELRTQTRAERPEMARDAEPEAREETPPTGRRRRTERNHYDEDGF